MANKQSDNLVIGGGKSGKEGIRLLYANVGTPYKTETATKTKNSYEVTMLIPKSDKRLCSMIHDAIKSHIEINNLGRIKAEKKPFQLASENDNDGVVENYGDNYYLLKAKTSFKPKVYGSVPVKGQHLKDIDTIDSLYYGGSWAVVVVNFYNYHFNGNDENGRKLNVKGIGCNLKTARFYKHDERLGGASDVDVDIFGECVSAGEEDEFFSGSPSTSDKYDDDDDGF